jgi:hypothetical protein
MDESIELPSLVEIRVAVQVVRNPNPVPVTAHEAEVVQHPLPAQGQEVPVVIMDKKPDHNKKHPRG